MKRRCLFFTDPHFTDREQDAYRWELFPFLRQVENNYGTIDELWCLGDLTEFKDCHSSRLIHRIVDELHRAPGKIKHVVKGNHDYVDEREPFFDWLGELRGSGISYYSQSFLSADGVLILPHTRNPVEEWKLYWESDDHIQLVLAHLTVDGCQSEMGQVLPGISRTAIPGSKALVLSGDIHKPQHLGPDFIYIGTPYSTRFSPAYEPRVLLLEFDPNAVKFDPTITSIPTGLKRKITKVVTMEEVQDHQMEVALLGPEDELRVSVRIPQHLSPSEWKNFKEDVLSRYPGDHISLVPLVEKTAALPEAVESGVGLHSRPEEAFSEYCSTSSVPDNLQSVGRDLLRRRLQKTSRS